MTPARGPRGVLLPALLLLAGGCVSAPRALEPLPPSWGGATVFDASLRSESAMSEAVDAMARTGLRVLRMTVLDIEDPLGKWNDEPLARLDAVIAEARAVGVRLMIVLHAGGSREDAYSRRHPGGLFYTDAVARAAFRRRLEHVLAYRGPETGVAWRDLGESVYAWELQGQCDWFHRPEWVEDMAWFFKQQAPAQRVACPAGRVSGSTLVRDLMRESPSIDVWTYRPTAAEPFDKAAAALSSYGRPWLVCDFGGPRDQTPATRRVIDEAIRTAREHRVPWLFWSLGQDRRALSHDLWPGDLIFDTVIAPAARK